MCLILLIVLFYKEFPLIFHHGDWITFKRMNETKTMTLLVNKLISNVNIVISHTKCY